MSSLSSSYAGALILASMAALGAAYLGSKASDSVETPEISMPSVKLPSMFTSDSSPPPPPAPEPPAPEPSAPPPVPEPPPPPKASAPPPMAGDHITEEEARRKLTPYVSQDGIDAMFKFVKTPVADWKDLAPSTMRLSRMVFKTLTHPDKCPAALTRICSLVFDKYSQMKSAIEGEKYNERGNVWGKFADLVDELPDPEEPTVPEPETAAPAPPPPEPPSEIPPPPVPTPSAPPEAPEAPSIFERLADAIGIGSDTKTDSGTASSEPSALNNPKMERALEGITPERNRAMMRGEYVPSTTVAPTEAELKSQLDELHAKLGMTPGELPPKEEQQLMSMYNRGVPEEVLRGKKERMVETLKRQRPASMEPTPQEQPPTKMSRGE